MEIKSFTVKCLVVVAFFSLIVLSGINAWTDPTSDPPTASIYPPLNTGPDLQIKAGNLAVGDGINALVTVGNIIAGGNIVPFDDLNYDIGSSTAVWNNGYFGTGYFDTVYFDKGFFTTLDPIYKINDKKYVTYVSDTIGLKAEVIGEAEFKGNNFVIDLNNQKEGSDLWLFYNIVKKDTIIPFVSSQSPVGIYGYIQDSEFIIKTIGENTENVRFSYRLVGERIDNITGSNVAEDQNISTYIDVDKIK